MMRSIKKIGCISLMVLVGLPAFAKPSAEVDMIMPVLEIDRVIAERIVELVRKESGLRINLVPLPDGTASALDALEAGYGDIAFAPNTGRFRDGISTVIPLYPSVLHVVTDKDRPADSLKELLKGATVYAGPPDSITRALTDEIVGGLEFAPGDVTFASDGDGDYDVIVI